MKKLLVSILVLFVLAFSVAADPVLTAIGEKNVNEGIQLTFNIASSLSDDGDTVFTLNSNAPVANVSSATIGGNTATLTWTSNTAATFTWTAPLVDVDTNYSVTFKTEDGNTSTEEIVNFEVANTVSGVSITDLDVGSSSQVRSNQEIDDDEDGYTVHDEASFTISNNNIAALQNVQVTWPSAAQYNISMVSSTLAGVEIANGLTWTSIPAGTDVDVVLRVRIPEDFDSFDKDASNPNDDRSIDIGDLTLTATGLTAIPADIIMEAENQLDINDFEICVDDDCDDIDDGDTVEDVEPGAKITIKLNAENKFAKSDEVDMEDVEFSIFVDEDELDEDDEESIGDLNPREDGDGEYSFTVDKDTDEDDYTIEIRLFGEDSNGAVHGEALDFKLEVKLEDEKIGFNRVDLDDAELDLCANSAKSTTLRVEIENEGSDDTDEVVLIAKNSALNFYSRTLKIDLDDGDDYDKTMTIELPNDARAGTYQIDVYTYFDFDQYDDEEINQYASVDLKVKACSTTPVPQPEPEQPEEEEEEEVTVIVTEPIVDPEPVAPAPSEGAVAVPVTTSTPEESSNLYIGLLILAYIVVIAVGIGFLVRIFARK